MLGAYVFFRKHGTFPRFCSKMAPKNCTPKCIFSSGASGGCLHGGASFQVEKAHFCCTIKGSGEPQKWSRIAPPSVPPPKALYDLLVIHQSSSFPPPKEAKHVVFLVVKRPKMWAPDRSNRHFYSLTRPLSWENRLTDGKASTSFLFGSPVWFPYVSLWGKFKGQHE